MQAKRLYSVASDFGILREDVDAILRSQRVHITAAAKLLDGAHHAVALYAAKLALLNLDAILRQRGAVMSASNATAIQNNGNLVARLDVVRTGYDLDHASASDPYLADHQLLSVGMLLDGNNLTDYDLLQVLVQAFIAFYFGAA